MPVKQLILFSYLWRSTI